MTNTGCAAQMRQFFAAAAAEAIRDRTTALTAGGAVLPHSLAHIALDPVDPAFDDEAFVDRQAIRVKVAGGATVSGIDEAIERHRQQRSHR